MKNYLKFLQPHRHFRLVSPSALSPMQTLAQTLSLFVLSFSSLLFTSTAQANPIQADTTLRIPSAVSCVANSCIINGGTLRGSNLLHSFTQFSVPTGGVAQFNNDPGVVNIFSRITGTSISNIDGLLKTNGTANLFLLNPNGIVFGPNAQLSINGSFLASTASGIQFADGSFFSTTPPSTPLLTVSVPVGLQFGSTPGKIVVQSQGNQGDGLIVPPNQTLALVGGDISVEGGILQTAGGRIELGSVGSQSLVSLTPIAKGWALGYNGVSVFQNIQLSGSTAYVNASGAGGGDIQVQGKTVSLTSGAQIEASTLGSQPGGTLIVNATDAVEVTGKISDPPSGFFTEVYPPGSGAGGKLTISTQRLLLDGAALIDASAFPNSIGKAGDVTINTGSLIVRNGAQLDAASIGGKGAGGNININATDLVQLSGANSNGIRSALFTVTTGNAPAGDLRINTSRLIIENGARASTSTRLAGNGGTLTVNANSVELSGVSPNGKNPSGLFALSGELGTGTDPKKASGAGGSLIINTGQLIVRNGAQVSASALGTGTAGNLNITAQAVNLDNAGSIRAETQVGTGGNINLQAQNYQMRHNSNLTTSASQAATGGNITLNTNTLLALENSNITANAVRGSGGNINITTQGVFLSPNSAITASSDLGVNGVVQVQILGFDVTNTLTPFRGNFVSTEQVVAGSCLANRNRQQGTFVVTGTGGLVPTPYDPISGRYNVVTLQPLRDGLSRPGVWKPGNTSPSARWKIGDPIVEAQSIVVTPDGRTLLAASSAKGMTESSNMVCHPS